MHTCIQYVISLQVVVVFFADDKFEAIPALTTITANEIVEAPEIVFHRDLRGMGNPGVFLKKNTDVEDGEVVCCVYVCIHAYT